MSRKLFLFKFRFFGITFAFGAVNENPELGMNLGQFLVQTADEVSVPILGLALIAVAWMSETPAISLALSLVGAGLIVCGCRRVSARKL